MIDYKIVWNSEEPMDPNKEVVDIRLSIKGEEYSANFMTLDYLQYLFEKNQKTGECASGRYFSMPNLILVQKIDDDTIRNTIEDLIKNEEVLQYFSKPI
ncbi:hypothetical protein CL616_01090 [archaeon]|nr:hypothetical protein [archaeon]|tara:strand:+ start:317 stop:613 length:297 start_codon:yes stop_codon:yes gene_type:complete